MIRTKLWAGVAAAAAVVAIAVFSPGGSTDVTEAQGPNAVTVEFELANGGVIPGVGGAVATQVRLGIAHNGTAATDAAPSDQAFFDTTVTRSSGTATTRGPGHPGGGGMVSTAIGTRAGIIGFTIQTNQVVGCGPSGICISGSGGTATFSHAVTQCGDNYGTTTTRDYSTSVDSQVTVNSLPTPFGVFVGNMAGKDTLLSSSTAFLGWDSTPDELLYQHAGGQLIQTYDDDNDNGVPDSQEGSPANEDAVVLADPADPYAIAGAGSAYPLGSPETQHDRDNDGLPEGHEFMPDFLPLLAEALGLRTYWEGRTYGIADVFAGAIPATDVHFLGFGGVPGVGGVTFTVLANPFSPPNPANQGTTTCPPFFSDVDLQATTTTNAMGPGSSLPPAGRTSGLDVTRVTAAGPNTIALFVTDGDDYDQDGRVGGLELCATDSDNSDADNDLQSGNCDRAPATWDNDGDGDATTADRGTVADLVGGLNCDAGASTCDNDVDKDNFIDNADNCPPTAGPVGASNPGNNPDQADGDGDGVGDVCDALVTTDGIAGGLPAGKGSGSNTSALIDNDLNCSRTWSAGGTLALGAASCTDIEDANDDGIPDAQSTSSDEDGDGFSDAFEVNAAPPTNPLDPNSKPACITNPAGTATGTDTDGDHLLDTCEAAAGTTVGDNDTDNDGVEDGIEVGAGTNPLSGSYTGPDTDGDGCPDADELAAHTVGGAENLRRHPGSWWDNFDVNGTGDVDLSDALFILGNFGVVYLGGGAYSDPDGQNLDRTRVTTPGPPGLLIEGNDGVDLSEALANLFQFGWGAGLCAAPGAVPGEGGGKFS